MVDSSGSVGKENFERMKSFVKNLTYYHKLGLDETRISVMSFSTKSVIEIFFSRDLERNKFAAAVDEIPYMAEMTKTGDALKYANSDMFSSSFGARGTGTASLWTTISINTQQTSVLL